MKGCLKKMVAAVLVLIVLAVAGIIGGSMLLDRTIEDKVAEQLENADIGGIPVRVSGVDVSTLGGESKISYLSIGNPPGFEGKAALECDDITLDVDVKTIGSRNVRIRRATMRRPVIHLQQDPGKLNNIAMLEQRMSEGMGKLDAKLSQAPVNFSVDHLTIEGGVVKLPDGRSINLPDMDIQGAGMGPTDIARQAMSRLSSEVSSLGAP